MTKQFLELFRQYFLQICSVKHICHRITMWKYVALTWYGLDQLGGGRGLPHFFVAGRKTEEKYIQKSNDYIAGNSNNLLCDFKQKTTCDTMWVDHQKICKAKAGQSPIKKNLIRDRTASKLDYIFIGPPASTTSMTASGVVGVDLTPSS